MHQYHGSSSGRGHRVQWTTQELRKPIQGVRQDLSSSAKRMSREGVEVRTRVVKRPTRPKSMRRNFMIAIRDQRTR